MQLLQETRHLHVREVLGRGGFGTVFAVDLVGAGGFVRRVALKVLNPGMEERAEVAVRLRDEARILAMLQHRAIVQVDDLLRVDGRWAVLMEHVEGVDLRRLLGHGPVPVGVALDVVAEIAGALHAAYEAPGPDGRPLCLLHRDIKPANVQLTAAGEVKLLDFGVARADFDAREAHTQRLFFGSLPYMAPERLEFVDGPEADVYAVGVLLFELVTGEAFGETSNVEREHDDKIADARRRFRRMCTDAGVEALLADLLAFDPADRPTARDAERRARGLRRGVDDPWLSDWAEVFVPPLLSWRPAQDDPLIGRVLGDDTADLPRAAREVGWSGWGVAVLAGAITASCVVAGGLALAAGIGLLAALSGPG